MTYTTPTKDTALVLRPHDALLVVDLQNDFCPGGALGVAGGDRIIPLINKLSKKFPHVLLTQDWHPPHHISFASSHMNRKLYETVQVAYGPQTLWPDHCLEGTFGAEFHKALDTLRAELVLRKGYEQNMDSYSAFLENDHKTHSGFAGYLRERGIKRLFLCGLAYDFCVHFTAVDGTELGFECIVIEDACRAVGLPGTVEGTNAVFAEKKIKRIRSRTLLG